MSREYVNGRWCVRCPKTEPTPYLKRHWKKLLHPYVAGIDYGCLTVLDLGCGNGRNTDFMGSLGFPVISVDMCPGAGHVSKCRLGIDPLPVNDHTIDIVLANYVFMFLSPEERGQVFQELRRVKTGVCRIMVELYPAKDSYTPDEKSMSELQQELFDHSCSRLRILYSKGRFIANL